MHIVTTDITSGGAVVLSEGSAAEAIVAATAIPGAFAPIHYRNLYLADGAISSNTPVRVAVRKGAKRLIVMPTGYACAAEIARQLISELEGLDPSIEYYVVPPLCPLVGSPYDCSRSADHIERAIRNPEAWLVRNGLGQREIPGELRPHGH